MKKNLLKRIGAVALALAVSLTMGTAAFAAEDEDGTLAANGVLKNADHSSVGTTLTIPKGVTVYGSLDKVYGPTVDYTYTIAPVDPASGAKVIDFNNKEATVKKGPADSASLTDATAAFTSSALTLSSGSYETTDNIVVSIATNKFSKPGIYRYVITDTTSTSTLYAAGITRPDDYVKARYLDVYVKYNSDGTAFEVYGFVLTDSNLATIEGKDDQPLQWETPAKKSSGFIASSETAKGTDEYHTIDVKVTKAVTGTMGDKTNEFPFTIAVSNSNLHYYSGESTSVPTAVSALSDGNNASVTGNLKDGDVFYIYGLNPKATVGYTEENNLPELYKLTVTDSANAKVKDNANPSKDIDGVDIAKNATVTTADLAVSNYNVDNSDTSVAATIAASNNKAVTFTNDLSEISPTNVVMRFAPYLFILGAAIVLLVMMRRRRASQDAE